MQQPPTVGAANADMEANERPTTRDMRTNPPVRVPSKLDRTILQTQAKAALTSLGWKPAIALAAVTAASAAQGAEMTLEGLIRESLRRCPVPRA
jgi:Holliday junction resolvasome RuvABC DNA-binding subunit